MSLYTICQKTPINYLISDDYHQECQNLCICYDNSDRWTRKELNKFKYFIEDHDIRHCNKIMSGKSTWTQAPKKFMNHRINLIHDTKLRNQQCNTITTILLLSKGKSYFTYLPYEILSLIIFFYNLTF